MGITMADAKGHAIMTGAALRALSAWQRAVWRREEKELIHTYCMYADTYFSDKKKEAAPYMEMSGGKLPVFPWERRAYRKDGSGNDSISCAYYGPFYSVFTCYLKRIIGALQKKDVSTAARFAGVLAHVIEDCASPAHACGTDMSTDMEMIRLLLPAPSDRKRIEPLHQAIEKRYPSFSLDGYEPVCLGFSPDEAAFHLMTRFTDMIDSCIALTIPMVRAHYADDTHAMRKFLGDAGASAARLVADVLCTAACIAYKKHDRSHEKALSHVDMTTLVPVERTGYAPKPYFYHSVRNTNRSLNADFQPVPLMLISNGASRRYEKGFGVGVPFAITYRIPTGVYSHFSAIVGVHTKLGGKGAVFSVVGDGKTLYTSDVIRIRKAMPVTVPLGRVKELSLIVRSAGKSKAAMSDHAVWAKPVLIKGDIA